MKVVDKDRIRKVLKETVLALCQTGMEYSAELCVEGLLGITLDQKDIILVNINEVVRCDLPRDLSISKRSSDKRKAEFDVLNNNTVHNVRENNLTPFNLTNKKPRPLEPEFAKEECADAFTNGDDCTDPLKTLGTLRIPIITPEHAFPQLPYRERRKVINNVAEKHTEISRILGNANNQKKVTSSTHSPSDGIFFNHDALNIYPVKEELGDYSKNIYNPVEENKVIIPDRKEYSVESKRPMVNMELNHRNLSRQHQEYSQDYAAAQHVRAAQLFNFLHPTEINLSRPVSSTNVSLPLYTSPSVNSLSSNSNNSQPQPLGLVVDTNVQPPAPLAVVAGTGMLKQVEYVVNDTSITSSDSITTPRKNENAVTLANDIYASPGSVKSENKTPGNTSNSSRGSKEFRRFRCTLCPASSSRKFNLQRHMKSHHPGFDESYILDLTPKERGGQCLKVDDKLSPQSAGFHYNQNNPTFFSDDLSNNSDMAMDLSSAQFGNDFLDYGFSSQGENGSSSSSNMSTAHVKSNVASHSTFNINKNDNRSTSQNGGIEPELFNKTPVSSGKIIARLGKGDKEGGNRSRKGLDQVLFSKFGCYTDIGSFGSDFTMTESMKSQSQSSLVVSSQKENCKDVVIPSPESKIKECINEKVSADSVSPVIIIPTTVDEQSDTPELITDDSIKIGIEKELIRKPSDKAEIGETLPDDKVNISGSAAIVLVSNVLSNMDGGNVNKIMVELNEDLPLDTTEKKCVEKEPAFGIDRTDEQDEMEMDCEKTNKIQNDSFSSTKNKTQVENTKAVVDYIFSSSLGAQIDGDETAILENGTFTAKAINHPDQGPTEQEKINDEGKEKTLKVSTEESKNNKIPSESENNETVNFFNSNADLPDIKINFEIDDSDDTDTIEGDHSDGDDLSNQDEITDDKAEGNIDELCADVDDVMDKLNPNDENDNEDGGIKLKVLRSGGNKSSEYGHKTRLSPRESINLRTRSRSNSKSMCT